MIAPLLWCLLAVPGLPGAVVIATPRGQTSVPITLERGGAAVAVPLLAQPLGLTVAIEGSSVAVTAGGAALVFQLCAPFVCGGGEVNRNGTRLYISHKLTTLAVLCFSTKKRKLPN